MRFEIVGKNIEYEETKIGEIQRVRSLMLQTQTHVPPYDVVRGEFLIDGTELQKYIEQELTYEEIAEIKLKAILEIDVTPLDAHQFANIERQAINAISEVRSAREDLDVAKAEIKASAKKDVEEAKVLIKEEVQEVINLQVEEIKEENTNKIKELEDKAKIENEYLKSTIRKLIRIDEMMEEEIEELINLYPKWEENLDVNAGDCYSYENKLYKVIQAHKTQADWTPDKAESLFNNASPQSDESGGEIIPELKQPTGAHDAYKIGDKVIFKDNVYESLIDNNAHSPEAYAAGWRIVE